MGFAFPWWNVDSGARALPGSAKKRETMYLRELEERAALLFRLRYSKDEARRRLRGNVQWDFELHRKPAFLSKVDALVEQTWKRGGRSRGGPPSPE